MSIIPYPDGINKWSRHKLAAQRVADALRLCTVPPYRGMAPDETRAYWMDRGDRMASCASVLVYTYCRDCGSMHIARSYLCRDRLCPVCSWRLSLQRAGEMWAALQYLYEAGCPIQAAMLTLTIKSVPGAQLPGAIDSLMAAWARLRKRRVFGRWVEGYARSLEVTVGAAGYHPHLHVLVLWAHGYDRHISQQELCTLWGEALQVDYTPICDIRRAYDDSPDGQTSDWQRTMSAAIECTKYAVSGKIVTAATPDELGYIARALRSRRLIAYGGSIAAARAALHMTDDDSPGDVSEISIECPKCGSLSVMSLAYRWAAGGYLMGIPYTLQP